MAAKLRVLHCLRAPVGGLFRHVLDLARAQVEAGCEVGLIADATTGGEAAARRFGEIGPSLALGVTRVPMPRGIGLNDYTAVLATETLARRLRVDVLHGHGAKGGAYARWAGRKLKLAGQPVSVAYTPHGGSLHFESNSPQGLLFHGLERQLARITDGLIFESKYSRRVYEAKIGKPSCLVRVVPNGLSPADFSAHQPTSEARDVLFVGELRQLKGVDVLLAALARTSAPRPPTAMIVGEGPDENLFKAQTQALGLGTRVHFSGAMPAPNAFPLGRLMVVPSRAESLPYIVLEGAAAGTPMLLTNAGGIPEITRGTNARLLEPGDADELSRRLSAYLTDPRPLLATAADLKRRVAVHFTIAKMTTDILDVYARLQAQSASAMPAADFLVNS